MTFLEAYRRALASQMKPAMLLLAIGPVIVAALFWIFIMWWKWAFFMGAIDKLIKTLPYMDSVGDRLIFFGINVVPGVLTLWILAVLFIPLTLICALGFTSIAAMPVMLKHVAGRDYATLAQLGGGSFVGSLFNTLGGLLWFLLLAALTIPLWFIPVFGALVMPALLGLLNARVLRYDALADHATAEEMRYLLTDRKLAWRALGLGGAALNVVPFFWLFSTTLTGLAFIHYGLAALAQERAALAPPRARA